MYTFSVTEDMVKQYMEEIETLKDLVDYSADNYGEKVFFIFKRNNEIIKKTYRDCERDVKRFSAVLNNLNTTEKSYHVAILGDSSYEWVVAYLGTAYSGNVVVPLDVKEKPDKILKIITYTDVDVIVYDKNYQEVVDYLEKNYELKKTFYWDVSGKDKQNNMDEKYFLNECQKEIGLSNNRQIGPDTLSTIICTSGTTGEEKGVMLSHRNLVTNAIVVRVPVSNINVKLSVLPMHHCYCFTCDILESFLRGRIVFLNDSISNLFYNLRLFEPDIILGVPQIWKLMYQTVMREYQQNPQQKIADVKKKVLGTKLCAVANGGAGMDLDLYNKMKEIGLMITDGYGMTECSPVISTSDVTNYVPGSVGCLCYTYEARLIDGELCVKGPSVMLGYYKNPAATNAAIDKDGWLHTGDLCRIDKNNNIFIIGRKKNLIILSNGKNVCPEELEALLLEIPLVKDVIVFKKDDAICAEIYPDYANITEEQKSELEKIMMKEVFSVNKNLPIHKKIASFVIRKDDFKRTATGKIIRKESEM